MLNKIADLSWSHRAREERRLHLRASQPWLRVETEGFAYIVQNWSVGGAAIQHFHNAGPVGTLVTGFLGWSGAEHLLPFQADILRHDDNQHTALRWLDMDPDLLFEMDHAARHR